MRSKFLVFMQFFLIFLMILPLGASSTTLIYGVSISSIGFVVGLLALTKNRLGNFNIRPDVKEDGRLITTGIYKYIRHPMYLAVIIFMSGIVILYPISYEYILYSLLLLTLFIKIFYEEHLWRCESEKYKEYCSSSKRLIPFIF